MAVDQQMCMHYGSLALYSAVLHNVFLLYHVETFVSIYKIDKMSFWIGETIFLVWNSLNDPLFGWISDRAHLYSKKDNTEVVLKRLRALLHYGPLLGISFLAFWVSWIHPSLQFVICLCAYDGFLTMIDLNHSALLADLAVSADTRTRLNFYCSAFSAFGSLSVFLSYVVWSRDDMFTFQIFCISLSVISICGFIISTKKLRKIYMKKQKSEDLQEVIPIKTEPHLLEEKEALKGFIRQLSGHNNFVWFAVMNLIQVFHCHFNSNFFPLFLESLLGNSVSPAVGSILLGVSFIAPHINNLYFLGLCRKYGIYNVIQSLFWVKLVLSLAMLCLGPNYIIFLGVYIASNRVFTEGTCKLLTLVISDLVDEDYVIHGRRQAVSALLFGTAAFVSKPGQTLAPLVGTWLLSIRTGHDVFESGNTLGSIKLDTGQLDPVSQQSYREGVFQLLVFIPVTCAILQLLAWSRYTLKGSRLRWIKHVRAGAQYSTV